MPETTPLIKAALNLRVGVGFDVYERYLYNYILCYFYIIQNQYENAKAAIIENLAYVKEAGATYKIPLEHNLANLETIRRVEWFQNQCNYPENVYLLDSRFW